MAAKKELTHAERLLNGLQLCSRYPEFDHVSTGHNIIYSGPSPEDMSERDCKVLRELGWREEFEYDCWGFST